MTDDKDKPYTACPLCSGELRVIERGETAYTLKGEELWSDTDELIWCADCDGWTDDRLPPGVLVSRTEATLLAARRGAQ